MLYILSYLRRFPNTRRFLTSSLSPPQTLLGIIGNREYWGEWNITFPLPIVPRGRSFSPFFLFSPFPKEASAEERDKFLRSDWTVGRKSACGSNYLFVLFFNYFFFAWRKAEKYGSENRLGEFLRSSPIAGESVRRTSGNNRRMVRGIVGYVSIEHV